MTDTDIRTATGKGKRYKTLDEPRDELENITNVFYPYTLSYKFYNLCNYIKLTKPVARQVNRMRGSIT